MKRTSCLVKAISAITTIAAIAAITFASTLQTTDAFSLGSLHRLPRLGRLHRLPLVPRLPRLPLSTSTTTSTASTIFATPSNAAAVPRTNNNKVLTSTANFMKALWQFTRPHTLIGSALAIPSLHALAAPSASAFFLNANLSAILAAMIPSLLMNLYITGLNQITDVDIDKINKPNLPLCTGALSMPTATLIVTLSLLTSLSMGALAQSPGLNLALYGSAILGTLYSLQPFRWKRSPILAAFCIVAVRGIIVNAGFYAHALATTTFTSIRQVITHDPKCYLTSLFFGIFGIVIALMKDVPDVTGDEMAHISTFSVRMGQAKIFKWSKRLLTTLFMVVGAGFATSALSTTTTTTMMICRKILVATLAVVGAIRVNQTAVGVNPTNRDQVYDYYMHLWKLFYLCYFVLPMAR